MKKTEIALIIVVSLISFGVAWFLGNTFFSNPDDEYVKIEYMEQIGSGLTMPSEENFNAYTPNPTVEVYIGSCAYGEEWDNDLKICRDKKEFEGTEN